MSYTMSTHSPQKSLNIKEVTSLKNPLVKEVLGLRERAKARRSAGRFVVEGLREVARALEAGWRLESVLYDLALTSTAEVEALISSSPSSAPSSTSSNTPLTPPRPLLYVPCAPAVFEKIAYRASVPNVVGVLCAQDHSLSALSAQLEAGLNAQLTQGNAPLYLVVEGVEKPGNLGALLRTASALGVDAVWACDCPVDLYHPNALRNSLGGLFDLTLVQCKSEEALGWLKEHQVQVVTTYLEGASALHTLNLTTPSALVVGAEDKGVSEVWVKGSDALALIPMSGVVDSLNVSVAAGMALYEATRQRAHV